jgi:hypothetical protein
VAPALADDLRFAQFSIPGADLVIAMPGTPKSVADKTNPNGVVYKMYLSEFPKSAYAVEYTFIPRGIVPDTVTPQQYLDNTLKDLAKRNPSIELRANRSFTFADAAAAEAVFNQSGQYVATSKARVYARRDDAGNLKIYQCTVTGPPDTENAANFTRFLDSFRFVPK